MSPARRWVPEVHFSPARLAVVLVAVVALLWWQWPLIAGYDSRTDVVLMTDGFLTSTERPVTYRIHEDGRTVRWDAGATTWCGAAEAVRRVDAEFDPAAIVLSFADAGGCGANALTDAVRAAHGRRVLIVTQPGRSGIEVVADRAGATLVDPSRFIGDQPVATSMPCEWWESCPDNGAIVVRAADGSLTAEGGDRVARIIVAELS